MLIQPQAYNGRFANTVGQTDFVYPLALNYRMPTILS